MRANRAFKRYITPLASDESLFDHYLQHPRFLVVKIDTTSYNEKPGLRSVRIVPPWGWHVRYADTHSRL